MDKEFLKKEIEKLNQLPRNHASFFNWHDKEIKEIGIATDFFVQLEKISDDRLVEIENAEDPPDAKVITQNNEVIGIELTEIVNEKAIEHQIKGDSRYVNEVLKWNKDNTIQEIESIINKKNRLCENVPEVYERKVLLIFTDEPRLESHKIEEYIQGHTWPEANNFDEIYILTGYEPKVGSLVLIKIKGS